MGLQTLAQRREKRRGREGGSWVVETVDWRSTSVPIRSEAISCWTLDEREYFVDVIVRVSSIGDIDGEISPIEENDVLK